jgi:tetratricopeptide (TPR) repeat protein
MNTANIDTLISSLGDLQKDFQIESLFGSDTAAPADAAPFQQAEEALELLKELGLRNGDDPEDLNLLKSVGSVYERLLHLVKAQETFTAALDLAERLGDAGAQAFVLHRLGRVMSLQNQWQDALHYLDRSQEAYRQLGEMEGEARVQVDRGVVYQEQGDYEAASEVYRGVLAQPDLKRSVATYASNNLAVLATIRGDFDEAIAQYKICLEMYEETGNQREAARTYQNLGMTHADRQEWQEAMSCYSRSFEMAQANNQLDVMANTYLSQAELLLDLGDSSMVTACCVRALEDYQQIGDRLGEADAYRLLGRVFTLRKQWSTATSLFQDSIRLNEEYSNPLGRAEAYRDLAVMQASRGHKTDALASFERAQAEFEKLGARADAATVEHEIHALQA